MLSRVNLLVGLALVLLGIASCSQEPTSTPMPEPLFTGHEAVAMAATAPV